MLLRDSIRAFLSDLAITGRAQTTMVLYQQLLGPLSYAIGASRCLGSITRPEVVAYLSVLRQRDDSDSYIALNARVFKRFFAWAVEQGLVSSSPLQTLKPGPQRWQPARPLTSEEIDRLVAAVETPLERAMLVLLLDTGLRASELTRLRLEDIDLEANEIRVKGKGGRVRFVAVNEVPRLALLNYVESQVRCDGCLWPESWDRKKLYGLINALGRRAGVPRIHPHLLRHTFATKMRRAGIDVLVLQRLLGHSDVRTTLRYTASVEQEYAVQVHRQHPVVMA
jgi:integrase/recombinase XerD